MLFFSAKFVILFLLAEFVAGNESWVLVGIVWLLESKLSVWEFAGQSYGRKFYGGIGIHGMKGRSQFSVASVATEVNSVEQVGTILGFWGLDVLSVSLFVFWIALDGYNGCTLD